MITLSMDELFAQFLREKCFVTGCTEKTLTNFQESYKALKRVVGELPEVETLSRQTMKESVKLFNKLLTDCGT